MRIEYVIRSGRNRGIVCTPHVHSDGRYVVSKTRFARDYIRLSSLHDVFAHLLQGHRLRMSAPEVPTAPSLIALPSLRISPDQHPRRDQPETGAAEMGGD